MDERDRKTIRKLVAQGKTISRIQTEDFPQYPYCDIYCEAYEIGGSALGVKRKISNRLAKILSAAPAEQQQILDEIDELIDDLYGRLKSNQAILDSIRKALP